MTATTTFEGRPLPDADALGSVLVGDDRAWLVRASVVHVDYAERVVAAAVGLLGDPDPRARAAALAVIRALAARGAVGAVVDAVRAAPDDWVGVVDGIEGGTLAQGALRLAVELWGVRRAGDFARWALAVPELRVEAWRALGAEEPEIVLPHLAALLSEDPTLAGEVATRFALVHGEHCIAACHAIAGLPLTTRRAFGATLEKHLRRVFAIRRWVECRQVLLGR